jgi:hypothetical protein
VAAACHGEASGPTLTPRSAQLRQFAITHTDGTPFADFTFTAFSILRPDTGTLQLTVAVTPRAYGFTIGGPANLAFDAANRPTVTLSYGRYVDRTVYDSTGRYASFAAFEQALRLWRQRAPDDWIKESDVGPTVSATIAGPLGAPGTYLIAAPK